MAVMVKNPPPGEDGSPSDSEILRRFQNGDGEAITPILERYLPWIRQRVSRLLGDRLRRKQESGDVVQQAILEFLRDAPNFIIEQPDHLRKILLRIAMNVIRDDHDYYRAKRREMARECPIPSSTLLARRPAIETPSAIVSREEEKRRIRIALELAEPEDRSLVLMRMFDELEYAEIGRRLGVTPDAARMRFGRASARLASIASALLEGRLDSIDPDRLDGADDPGARS